MKKKQDMKILKIPEYCPIKKEMITNIFSLFIMIENTNIEIHIGEIISKQLQSDGRKKIWLAEQINLSESGLCRMLKKRSISTNLLLKISIACQHDFASYLSKTYKEYTRR